MTALAADSTSGVMGLAEPPDGIWRRAARSGRVAVGGAVLGLILVFCVPTLFWTANPRSQIYYDNQNSQGALPPAWRPLNQWFGTDVLGRCLMGGVISLTIGIGSAAISVALGVAVGLLAGYRGGWVDAVLMRRFSAGVAASSARGW